MEEEPQLRPELADVSFEDLQQIEQKVGSKLYNEVLFGQKEPIDHRRKEQNESRDRGKKKHKQRKDQPLEMSSKRPVHKVKNVMNAKKRVFRDPRFDDLSGSFKEETFEKNYSFIKDIKKRERESVQKALRNCEDEEEAIKLKKLLYRMLLNVRFGYYVSVQGNSSTSSILLYADIGNSHSHIERVKFYQQNQQDIAQKKRETKRSIQERLKAQETQFVKEGKKPYFLKKSDRKVLELAEKYKELKKSGKLEKYLAKKRKKNMSKDRRQMPSTS
ncbi:Ribosomal RNA processing protein 36-like [Holothuria leucospilota]|uniref:rRNA biogenesis protein RRP36 n=1 Tax=Holothuria leucospilota TaxID=206669 RepID=A0A9Q1BTV3_HOLLE|nr:Ribosomal RNA processing protein 36-like [Holothuria leucospilota]